MQMRGFSPRWSNAAATLSHKVQTNKIREQCDARYETKTRDIWYFSIPRYTARTRNNEKNALCFSFFCFNTEIARIESIKCNFLSMNSENLGHFHFRISKINSIVQYSRSINSLIKYFTTNTSHRYEAHYRNPSHWNTYTEVIALLSKE